MLHCRTNQEPFQADKVKLLFQKPLDWKGRRAVQERWKKWPANAAVLFLLCSRFNVLCTMSCRSPITCLFLIDKLCKVRCAECSHFHFHIIACNPSCVLLKDVLTHRLQPEEGLNDSCLIYFTNVFSPSFLLRLLVLLCLQTFLVNQSCWLKWYQLQVKWQGCQSIFCPPSPHTSTLFFYMYEVHRYQEDTKSDLRLIVD